MSRWPANHWIMVFAKEPNPGAVMTRLCPPLTPVQAAEVQFACLVEVLEQAAAIRPGRLILVTTPDDCQARMNDLLNGRVEIWPQGSGDLGERLLRSARRAHRHGAAVTCFLGADSPTLPWDWLAELPSHLQSGTLESNTDGLPTAEPADRDEAKAAIGPCRDGGYYFLAMQGVQPGLLEAIDWGSDRVAEQTRRRASQAKVQLIEGPPGYDIDEFPDLVRAAKDLEHTGRSGKLLSTMQSIIKAVECDP